MSPRTARMVDTATRPSTSPKAVVPRRGSGWSRRLLVAGIGLVPIPLQAQVVPVEPASPERTAASTGPASHRSPLVAALLQAALPPLPVGYVYAGAPLRGLVPTGIMVGGALLFLSEGVEVFDWTGEGASESLLRIGFAAIIAGYVYGIWDAADAARDHNARSGGAAVAFIPTAASRVSPDPLEEGAPARGTA